MAVDIDNELRGRGGGGALQRQAGRVHRALKREIMLGVLPPGQPLVELDVANTMNCSQGTVREALLRLQQEGLIVRNGYRGSMASPLSEIEAPVMLDLREQLEVEGVRRSAGRVGRDDIARLGGLVDAMERAAVSGDAYAVFEFDLEFHLALFRCAGMPTLEPVLVRTSLYNHRIKMAGGGVAPAMLPETARRHRAIVAALAAGDVGAVESVLRHHIRNVAGDPGATRGEPPLAMTPALAALWQRTQQEDGGLPDITTLPLDAGRSQFERTNERWNRIDGADFTVATFAIPRSDPARGGTMGVLRIARRGSPGARAGTILHLHGGGWVFGSNRTHLGAMARLAETTGCEVVGVEYGLAPEAPFPQGLNDCAWAWRWLRAQGTGDAPWYVAGDSAGANLALAMLVDLKRTGEPLPAAALLFYGVYDADHDTRSHRRCGDGSFGLSSAKMAWYRNHYLAGGVAGPWDPRVSPLRADLSGLPPLFVTGAGLDPLYDDSARLAERLARAGTSFEFRNYPGMNHGFMQMGGELPEAYQPFLDAAAFLRARHRSE